MGGLNQPAISTTVGSYFRQAPPGIPCSFLINFETVAIFIPSRSHSETNRHFGTFGHEHVSFRATNVVSSISQTSKVSRCDGGSNRIHGGSVACTSLDIPECTFSRSRIDAVTAVATAIVDIGRSYGGNVIRIIVCRFDESPAHVSWHASDATKMH